MEQQTTPVSNYSNGTTYGNITDDPLYIVYNTMLILITIIIMFSMGTSITIKSLKLILSRPVGPILGFVCQSLILPAVCFGYAIALDLDDNLAIGMVLTGSCPGGTISNIIAFWAKADIILSITMTTISTTLAIGFLPLNMFLYSTYWIEDESKIPYANMVFTVLYLWAAVIVGYIVGRIWPKTVPYFTKIGSIVSLLLILGAGVVQGQLYPELFDLGWEAWFGGITMPLIGFLIGFILALIFCQGHPQRLAIGLETGVQNTTLALTVVAVSFPNSYEASYYSQYIIIYTTWQVVFGIAAVIIIWFYNYLCYRETPCAMAREQGGEGGSEAGRTVSDWAGDTESNMSSDSAYSAPKSSLSGSSDSSSVRKRDTKSDTVDVVGFSVVEEKTGGEKQERPNTSEVDYEVVKDGDGKLDVSRESSSSGVSEAKDSGSKSTSGERQSSVRSKDSDTRF